MNTLKYRNAIKTFRGFKGDQTLKAIISAVNTLFPDAAEAETGRIYGMLMDAYHQGYQAGKHSGRAEMWVYDDHTSWLMGISHDKKDLNGHQTILEFDERLGEIKITDAPKGAPNVEHIYKKVS